MVWPRSLKHYGAFLRLKLTALVEVLMMNITGKKPDVSLILEKMKLPKENSAEAVKASNEAVAALPPVDESIDEVSAETAMAAAATSLQAALDSKDAAAIAAAIKELFELFSLGK